MVTARRTNRRPSVWRVRHGTAGTVSPSGWMISVRISCFKSLSVGNVPDRDSEPTQPTWITSWITRAAGHCSLTEAICKACVIAAIAERPCRNAGNSEKIEWSSASKSGTIGRSFGRGRVSSVRLRGSSRTTPAAGKFRKNGRKTAWTPSCGKISPPEIYDIAVLP